MNEVCLSYDELKIIVYIAKNTNQSKSRKMIKHGTLRGKTAIITATFDKCIETLIEKKLVGMAEIPVHAGNHDRVVKHYYLIRGGFY